MSTKQINDLLSSFSTVNESSDFGEKESKPNEQKLTNDISEKNLLYINSLNCSQEQVIDTINKIVPNFRAEIPNLQTLKIMEDN